MATLLLANFDSIAASTNFAKDFTAVAIDRLNRAYEAVMQWTKIFLADKSFTSFAGKSQAQAHGKFLFDVSRSRHVSNVRLLEVLRLAKNFSAGSADEICCRAEDFNVTIFSVNLLDMNAAISKLRELVK